MISKERITSLILQLSELEKEISFLLKDQIVDSRLGQWIVPVAKYYTKRFKIEIDEGDTIESVIERNPNKKIVWDYDDNYFYSKEVVEDPNFLKCQNEYYSNLSEVFKISIKEVKKLSQEEIDRKINEINMNNNLVHFKGEVILIKNFILKNT